MASSVTSSSSAISASGVSPHIPVHPRRSTFSFFPSSFLLRRRIVLSQENVGMQRTASRISPVSELAVDSATNSVAVASELLDRKIEGDVPERPLPSHTANGATIASVMVDVTNLVKLVDSGDIVELELKQPDYELVIRKKEALPPHMDPQSFAPHMITHSPIAYMPYSAPPPSVSPCPVPEAIPATPLTITSAASTVSNELKILSPMAGTFYKCPAPGEPPFVKVGDQVTKGQVVCIVEAMKLMNEIEADQSGTVVEILMEDGKPVSIDTPLFAIKP